MKKYSILTASVVIPLVIFGVFISTTNFLNEDSELVIKTGWSGGFCYGYCMGDVELTSEKIVFHSKPKVPLDSSCSEITKEIPFTKEEFQSLVDLVDLEKFNELPDAVGRLGITDAPVFWIEISSINNNKRITFEQQDAPAEIKDFAFKLIEISNDLKSQYLSPARVCFDEEILESGNASSYDHFK